MKTAWGIIMIIMLLGGCSKGPESGVKYNFASKQEYLKYYLPSESKHGGIKKWTPAMDPGCNGGKHMTLADGFEVIFCPANGNQDLFKLGG